MPPSNEARLAQLEKNAEKVQKLLDKLKEEVRSKATKASLAKVNNDLDEAEKEIQRIIKWIKLETLWSKQVTQMLRMIDWDLLATDYPGGGGTNPPQTPPDWPPPE